MSLPSTITVAGTSYQVDPGTNGANGTTAILSVIGKRGVTKKMRAAAFRADGSVLLGGWMS